MRVLIALFCTASAWGQCSGYGYSATATVGTVTGTLTNFPLLLKITDVALKPVASGGKSQNAFDWCISDFANIASYSPVWSNKTGADEWDRTNGVLIVELAGVTVSTGAQLRVWIGNGAAIAHTYVKLADTNFAGVYPLQESALPYVDVSTGGNNYTLGTIPARVSGSLGFTQSFAAASSQWIQSIAQVSSGSTITLSALVKMGVNPAINEVLYDARDNVYMVGLLVLVEATTNKPVCYYNPDAGGPASITSSVALDSNPHHVGCTSDGTTLRVWVDGVQAGSVTGVGLAGALKPGKVTIGSSSGSGKAAFLNGQIQELRVSKTARCAGTPCAWMQAESDNLLTPSTFVTTGAFGAVSGGGGAMILRRKNVIIR